MPSLGGCNESIRRRARAASRVRSASPLGRPTARTRPHADEGLGRLRSMQGAPSSDLSELTEDEAARRLAAQGPNLLPTTPCRPPWSAW